MDLQATTDTILVAALAHVPFDGWTQRCLKAGAADAGLTSDMVLRAFPGGMIEVAEHFSAWADRRMLAALDGLDLETMRVRDRIAAGVRLRLEGLAPHREAVRRALSFFAMPQHAGLATRCAWRTIDAIWYAAGDTSTDFNFYTKRGLLAPVHASTVLYWLGDRSVDCADTWAYLDRRIDDVLRIGRLQSGLKNAIAAVPDAGRLFNLFLAGRAAKP